MHLCLRGAGEVLPRRTFGPGSKSWASAAKEIPANGKV